MKMKELMSRCFLIPAEPAPAIRALIAVRSYDFQ